jgi:hypothetical protein
MRACTQDRCVEIGDRYDAPTAKRIRVANGMGGRRWNVFVRWELWCAPQCNEMIM